VDVPLTKSNSIPTNGIGGGAKVMMRPAAPGTGVIAGGAVRTVLSWQVFAIFSKQLGSNPLNNATDRRQCPLYPTHLSEVAEERGIPTEKNLT